MRSVSRQDEALLLELVRSDAKTSALTFEGYTKTEIRNARIAISVERGLNRNSPRLLQGQRMTPCTRHGGASDRTADTSRAAELP